VKEFQASQVGERGANRHFANGWWAKNEHEVHRTCSSAAVETVRDDECHRSMNMLGDQAG